MSQRRRASGSKRKSTATATAVPLVWECGKVSERWEAKEGVCYVVQKAQNPDSPEDLLVSAGDVVRVDRILDDGWLEATNLLTTLTGPLAPSLLFHPSSSHPHRAPHGASTRQAVPPVCEGAPTGGTRVDVVQYGWWEGVKYFAQRRYTPAEDRPDDELKVTSGDVLEVSEVVDDNWMEGRNLTTGTSGMFPTSVLFASGEERDVVVAV
ncbi:hypothetical protein M427DRAFT_134053 [Gonapodya prolifera JEL478]|uniref:SH3 domain-containing protein n=1 Tax=Gonapodya prolifera (strain JEL478) TaxID=1344416 RepID=A0A139AI92_GONPJ|nr:hypothetical protein M427DRAFT_134053 [Gonapodya prolifera JEL478]|eukprot:KXS16419.1 hypothetical protein M427DRAFT_134053 [Gonapodya prolifera JEL478]